MMSSCKLLSMMSKLQVVAKNDEVIRCCLSCRVALVDESMHNH